MGFKDLIPTPVYDTYWKFATERQEVFYNRIENKMFPWTDDEILKIYKFTNAYRASDRVSQYLIKNVIYDNYQYSQKINDLELYFLNYLIKLRHGST